MKYSSNQRRKIKQVVITVVSMLLIVVGSLYAQDPSAMMGGGMKQTVAVSKITEVEDIQSRRYTGLVVSPSIVQVVPQISGEILEVTFKDGDYVKKGDVLYKIDPIRYEAAVKSAEAAIAECKATLSYAQKDCNRNQELYKKGVVTEDTLDRVLSDLEIAKASLLAAEANLILAKDDLNHTTIVAAIDGQVGVTNYTTGNYIAPSSGTLVTIIQTNPMRVRFSVSNYDLISTFGSLEKLKREGNISLRLADSSSYFLNGSVELVNNEANEKTDALHVYALFENPDQALITGSTISVNLFKKRGVTLPAVSPSAVVHSSKDSYVYIVNDKNIIEKRIVALGGSYSNLQIIKSGVKAGEVVVVDGTHKTREGSEIEPICQEL